MTHVAKRGLALLVLGFAVFYLLTQPESAAAAIKGALQAVGSAFDQILRFFSALVH